MKFKQVVDYTTLKPGDTYQEVEAILKGAIEKNFEGICVRPCDIDLAVKLCEGTNTIPCTVLDFPHGHGGLEGKAALSEIYAKKGIKEIDMVMNFAYARSGMWDEVKAEIKAVVDAAKPYGAIVKVIFEIGYLTQEDLVKATEICVEAGASYTKTCTGFFEPVNEEAVKTMVAAADGRIKVKVSGPGISDRETADRYIALGADKLGLGYVFADKILGEYLGDAEAANVEVDKNAY